MSDFEHELLMDREHLSARTRRLAGIARRALVSAREAQERWAGHHDAWIDEALREVEREEAA